jgi:hypothetical protein
MAERITPIDIGDAPELLQLAKEVHRSNESRVLRHAGEDLAMMVPLPRKQPSRRKKPTPEDYEAFRSAAGSWADVDTDKLIDDIYATRRRSNRPPVEL